MPVKRRRILHWLERLRCFPPIRYYKFGSHSWTLPVRCQPDRAAEPVNVPPFRLPADDGRRTFKLNHHPFPRRSISFMTISLFASISARSAGICPSDIREVNLARAASRRRGQGTSHCPRSLDADRRSTRETSAAHGTRSHPQATNR